MTSEELEKNYRLGSKVYVALKDLVYDVSSSEAYKPGSSYHVFAGKDASVALARMNFSPENFSVHWSEIEKDEKQKKTLEEWVLFYRKRYPIVAKLGKERAAGKRKED